MGRRLPLAATSNVRSAGVIAGRPALDGSDCVACGRCCHHAAETVTLLEADEARLGAELLAQYTYVYERPPHFRFVRNEHGVCSALDVRVPGHFPCKLYDVRPTGCRTVEAGSPACLEARMLGHLGDSVEFLAPSSAEFAG
jgi:uncharacterized protein